MAGKIEETFTKLSKGGDSIERSKLDAVFKNLDENNDGKLTRAEFSTAFVSKLNTTQEQADKVFSKLDTDNSGDISVEEISEMFWKMDTDKDGSVSKTEFITRWKQLMA